MVNAPATFNQAYYKGRQWPGPCTWPNTEIFPVYTGICRVTFSNGNISYGKYVDGNCGSVDATLAKVEVLGIVDGCGTPEGNKWSDCSVSCGFGTSTKGDQNRDCHALCETEAVRYCNLPMMPNDNRLNGFGYDNDNIEVFAEYPIRKSVFGKTNMECKPAPDGKSGYWAKDPLGASDDEYYIMRHGERCFMSCDSSLHDRPHKLSKNAISYGQLQCNDYGKIEHEDYQSGFRKIPVCEPEYCVFPSYGHWKETQQEGTTTNVGIECNGVDDVRKEGDFWFVPKDAECEFTFKADNVKAYRNGV